MSAPSVPSVPPRPARMQKEQRSVTTGAEVPLIPPRPAHRVDRSVSPNRDSFARSPLNESSFAVNSKGHHNGLYRASFAARSVPAGSNEASVKLPSIGQEGVEYASFYENAADEPASTQSDEVTSAPQTRNVGKDLELHAPKPALPTSSATARIATVTRTDSSQAAAVGLGKVAADDRDPHLRSLRAKASFTSHDSSTPLERVSSTQSAGDGEQGIPEIGQRVPMYPNAGDVQAPSPSPFGPSGEGYHRAGRHHGRTRSGREHFLGPPGSYGLHGHGTTVHDRFEKAWYEKHPEALEREEHGEYGPGIGGGRGEWALSREDLDRIVRETASRGAGVGTSPAVLGTPNEEIGYLASEEYAAKLASSRPASVAHHHKTQSNASQGHTESPLRKESFTADLAAQERSTKSRGARSIPDESDHAIESADEENVIHIDPPAHRSDKIGGGGYDPPTEDLGPLGGNSAEEGGWIDERGYGVPILASDEVAKEPGAENLHPAISPPLERSASELHGGAWDHEHTSHSTGLSRTVSRGSSVPGSRTNSRPTSMSGAHPALARFTALDDREEMGTPLEDVEEYEPLFPEDEEEDDGKDGKASKAKAFKSTRPTVLARHKFPSQDVWEDAPSSAQLQATVSTPAIPEDDAQTVIADPDEDKAPRDERDRLAQAPDTGNDSLPPADRVLHRMIPQFKPNVQEEVDPRTEQQQHQRQRFPSRDIWEDTPASLQLQTIVSTPQIEEPQSARDLLEASVDDGRASTSEGADKVAQPSGEQEPTSTHASSSTDEAEVPAIPPRPAKTKGAAGPEEIQPAIPPRPSRRVPHGGAAATGVSAADDTTGNASVTHPLSAQTSSDSLGDKAKAEQRSSSSTSASERRAPAIPERAKPQVPARPAKMVAGEGSATKNDAAAKPKPAVPARPNGSKIAALKAGFMSDLDKRLQLGPPGIKPAEKTDEPPAQETEKAPLSDARKGRARGPARRKPAASPSSDTVADSKPDLQGTVTFQLSKPVMIWQITPDGDVEVSGRSHQSPKASSVDVQDSEHNAHEPETDQSVAPPTEAKEEDPPVAPASEKSEVATSKPLQDDDQEAVTPSVDVQDPGEEEEPTAKPVETEAGATSSPVE